MNDANDLQCHVRELQMEVDCRQRKKAGPFYDNMAGDRSVAIQSLQHKDLIVREVAFSLFVDGRWRSDAAVEQICERQAFTGPRDVQVEAIKALAQSRFDLYGKLRSDTLSEFILNSAIPLDVRHELYRSLRLRFGENPIEMQQMLQTPRFQLFADLDREVIRRCITNDRRMQS